MEHQPLCLPFILEIVKYHSPSWNHLRDTRCAKKRSPGWTWENNIILMHFASWGHGIVVAEVVGPDPRIQGPTRASVDHGLPELQLLLDHFVPLCPETQFFRGVLGAECPVHIELRRYLVGPIEDMRGSSVRPRGNIFSLSQSSSSKFSVSSPFSRDD